MKNSDSISFKFFVKTSFKIFKEIRIYFKNSFKISFKNLKISYIISYKISFKISSKISFKTSFKISFKIFSDCALPICGLKLCFKIEPTGYVFWLVRAYCYLLSLAAGITVVVKFGLLIPILTSYYVIIFLDVFIYVGEFYCEYKRRYQISPEVVNI